MELCSIGHEEVCYEARFCPACAAIEELQGKIDDLTEEIKKLNEECDNYQQLMDADKEDR